MDQSLETKTEVDLSVPLLLRKKETLRDYLERLEEESSTGKEGAR